MSSQSLPVTVIGGINMDIHVIADEGVFLRGTSNPSTVRWVPGGVARNIAHNLSRLGVAVRLLGAVGDDAISDRLLSDTAAAGVDVSEVTRAQGTSSGLYVALLDGSGELDTGASDMSAMNLVDTGYIERCRDLLVRSTMIVADANIGAKALDRIVEIANHARVPVILDPVSVAKAGRIADLSGEIFAVTPDAAETPVIEDARSLTIHHTVKTLGPGGLEWTDHASATTLAIPARKVAVVDVTGAGDAFVAGFVFALVEGLSMADGLNVATRAAAIVVGSHSTTLESIEPADLLRRG